MIIIPISFKLNLSKMQNLFKEHWEEVASNKSTRSLNVNEDLFILMEEQNLLLTLGVFDENNLIGYSVNILSPDLHDKSKFFYANDAIYISPKYRNGSLGIKLIKEVEKYAKLTGAYGILCHAKPTTKLDDLLPRLGYTVKDILYLKEF